MGHHKTQKYEWNSSFIDLEIIVFLDGNSIKFFFLNLPLPMLGSLVCSPDCLIIVRSEVVQTVLATGQTGAVLTSPWTEILALQSKLCFLTQEKTVVNVLPAKLSSDELF